MNPQAFLLLCLLGFVAGVLVSWNQILGFQPQDSRWWLWLADYLSQTGTLPATILQPLYICAAVTAGIAALGGYLLQRPMTATHGPRNSKQTHGSAQWATGRDVRKTGLLRKAGVVVGGWPKLSRIRPLRHDGPEHVLAFAPTRSGKGVSLVVPTLLEWSQSALVLDIKGENYALTAGYRQSLGQKILKFDPAAQSGSIRYNPLEEVRTGTDHEIADCQNIAAMIIDPDGKGLKDFWMQSGFEWLTTALLHVIYRIKLTENRPATLKDVHSFLSVGDDPEARSTTDAEDPDAALKASLTPQGDDSFDRLLHDMASFNHGRQVVNDEVRRGTARMQKRAANERSGVHSTASVQLALYSDPIVARNISACDFRIADLMHGAVPASLYIIIPPSDILRLKPLVRILMNQILTRLTSEMQFENGASKAHYRHRLLLMLDEFTSIGKLEIFEKALAFMAGYGLKAYLIVQDLTQLQKEYSREESITSNCHLRLAFAPNRIETARLLSEMAGKTTLTQTKRSRSRGKQSSTTESTNEVARPLLTADECMALPGLRKDALGRVVPGDMLIFVAGHAPIYGRQALYFQDRELQQRASLPAPAMSEAEEAPADTPTATEPAETKASALDGHKAAFAELKRAS